ncbi:hypothetical protein D1610_11620 [Sphingomonas gilva]|uniref:Uncharacterized protein n=1 Tax=Sphingomonas gilva TaxID=2305907 RepID=A0A396RU28_9SPHN|nr:hypothetical protein [Sphingomonas gilva]RHW17191.1 hypothetical protein D1610_11620 [Sphingomonas gilva]
MVGLGEAFTFARPIAAQHRNASGIRVTAPAGSPRFDHDESGVPLGLLVELGPALGQGDRVRLAAPVTQPGPMTVLHAVLRGGAVDRRAIYTRDASATIDRCLAQTGRHQVIAALPGFVQPREGRVRAKGEWWRLASVLVDGAGAAIGVGGGRALIEG